MTAAPLHQTIIKPLCLPLTLALLLLASSSLAAEPPFVQERSATLSVLWENDLAAGSDRDYTNGLKVVWGSGYTAPGDMSTLPEWAAKAAHWLPLPGAGRQRTTTNVSIAQEMYTPEDRKSRTLLVDERPYAGWLAFSAGLHGRTERQQISYLVTVGLVGPLSLAEPTQKLIHTFLGGVVAQGWEHQLNHEVTVDAALQSRWRFLLSGSRRGGGVELIPSAGLHLGTARTFTETGIELRVGWRMADDFGSCQLRDDCVPDQRFDAAAPFGLHLFTRVNGRAVLHNVFLDGNLFSASHSVDREPLVAEIAAGFVVQYRAFRSGFSYVYMSREYRHQHYNQVFGSLLFSWAF